MKGRWRSWGRNGKIYISLCAVRGVRNMKNGEKSVASVDGLYRSVRMVIEEGRKVVSIAANAVLVRQNWSIGKLNILWGGAK